MAVCVFDAFQDPTPRCPWPKRHFGSGMTMTRLHTNASDRTHSSSSTHEIGDVRRYFVNEIAKKWGDLVRWIRSFNSTSRGLPGPPSLSVS